MNNNYCRIGIRLTHHHVKVFLDEDAKELEFKCYDFHNKMTKDLDHLSEGIYLSVDKKRLP